MIARVAASSRGTQAFRFPDAVRADSLLGEGRQSIGYKMINARTETVATYEWKEVGKIRTPSCFTMADDSSFAFAGLCEQWKNPEGQLADTCSIITTPPKALLQDVHDSMPVVLLDDVYNLWLDPALEKADAVCDLLKPFDPALMRRYEVSSRVNLVKNGDAGRAQNL